MWIQEKKLLICDLSEPYIQINFFGQETFYLSEPWQSTLCAKDCGSSLNKEGFVHSKKNGCFKGKTKCLKFLSFLGLYALQTSCPRKEVLRKMTYKLHIEKVNIKLTF